jgi:hypothetical protein
MALLTCAGRPLLAVATHCVYCNGQMRIPKRGLFFRHVSRCVAHCDVVSFSADVPVSSGDPWPLSTEPAQPETRVPTKRNATMELVFIGILLWDVDFSVTVTVEAR